MAHTYGPLTHFPSGFLAADLGIEKVPDRGATALHCTGTSAITSKTKQSYKFMMWSMLRREKVKVEKYIEKERDKKENRFIFG
ncbi:hypothetical protein M0804_003617 [Polistes exclamans]|nr:hypothetical protein M0804_003617 [Polistes exclamans]